MMGISLLLITHYASLSLGFSFCFLHQLVSQARTLESILSLPASHPTPPPHQLSPVAQQSLPLGLSPSSDLVYSFWSYHKVLVSWNTPQFLPPPTLNHFGTRMIFSLLIVSVGAEMRQKAPSLGRELFNGVSHTHVLGDASLQGTGEKLVMKLSEGTVLNL